MTSRSTKGSCGNLGEGSPATFCHPLNNISKLIIHENDFKNQSAKFVSLIKRSRIGANRLTGSLRAINATHRVPRMRYLSTSYILSREDRPKTTEGLSPRILKDNPPKAEDQAEDVKRHNKEMDERGDKAHAQVEKDTSPKSEKEPAKTKSS
jgi:hypothetical protein